MISRLVELVVRFWDSLNYYPVKYSGVVTIVALLGLWSVYRKVKAYEDKIAELAHYAWVISENTRREGK